MIPTLEAISNSVSVLPVAVAAGQPATGQPASGGFAATLAAALGGSSARPSAANSVEPSNAPSTEGAETAATTANVSWRTQASSNPASSSPGSSNPSLSTPQTRKLPPGSAIGLSIAAALNLSQNLIVPQLVPESALQISSFSSSPSSSSLLSPVPGSLSQLGSEPTPLTAVQVQVPEVAAGIVQPGFEPVASSAPLRADAASDATPVLATGPFAPAASSGNLTLATTEACAVPIPPVTAQIMNTENATATNVTLPNAISAAGPVNSTSAAQAGPQSAQLTVPESSVQSRILSTVMVQPVEVQPVEGPPLPHAAPPAPDNLSAKVATNSQPNVLLASAYEFGLVPSAPEAVPVAEPAGPAPILPVTGVEVLPVSLNPQSGQASTADAGATGGAIQSDPIAQAGNALAAIITGQIGGQAAQLVPGGVTRGRVQLPATVGTSAAATANFRGIAFLAGARASATSSLVVPESTSASLSAEQTPFSVFFSSPGPGTEAAASTLPRMILPATSSTFRDSHTSGANASNTNAQINVQINASPSVVAPGSAAQNPSSSNSKDSPTTTPASASLVVSSLTRDTGASAASMPVAAAQSTVPLAQAASVAAVLPLSGPAAPVANSLPKTATLTGDAPAANVTTATPEPPPVAVPGPVQMAQMVNRVEQSEMRIGMSTSAFGSVEVRTVVHANDVGLVIGSEKGDLRALLSNDLPAITSTLQEQNLRLHSVNFMQGFAFSNNASGGGGDSEQRPFAAPPRPSSDSANSEAAAKDSTDPGPLREYVAGSGLSILA